MTKGQTLGAGYDPMDHYDLGSKNQAGRIETRYGSVEQARRFVAMSNRRGKQVAVNVVHHHVDGTDKYGGINHPCTSGPTGGRFSLDKNCFWHGPGPNPDGVFNPSTDWSFGPEFRWFSGTYGDGKGEHGQGYVMRGLRDSLIWQILSLGVNQLFFDDIKGMPTYYIKWLMEELKKNPEVAKLLSFAFGELYDSNPDTLEYYIRQVDGLCGCLDFSLRMELRNWCNNPGSYDMQQLSRVGLWQRDAFNSVTFYEDADTDESGPISQRMLQAMAAVMTMGGYPMHFGKALYNFPQCYGLMEEAKNLSWIHEKFANGPLVWRQIAHDYVVYERPQAPGLLVALSNRNGTHDNPRDWTQVTVPTAWWPGTAVKDYTGHSTETRYVNGDGTLTFFIPPSDYRGRGYACWGQVGHDGPIEVHPITTTQHFYGASDLDFGPAKAGQTTEVGAIWSDPGHKITITPKSKHTGLTFGVLDPSRFPLAMTEASGSFHVETKARGRYMLTIHNATAEDVPYEIAANYMGMSHLTDAELHDPRAKVTHSISAKAEVKG